MNRQLDVDRVLEDWLAEGPSRLPDRVVRQTIDQLDDIQQRKPRWLPGSERMQRLILPAAGLAAVLAVVVVTYASRNGGFSVGGPSGTPFTSARHGYTVVLPAGQWTFAERPGTWGQGEFFDANSGSGVDYYERLDPSNGTPLYVYLASQPIPTGMTFDAWAATHDAANQREMACFQPQGQFETVHVGGEPARVGVQRCDQFDYAGAWVTVQTLVAHGGRGYAIYVWPVYRGTAMPAESQLKSEALDWLSRFSFKGP
ncbi:MAG TPA: hypothetical protein VEX41_04260 [Candidatus Eisenbacteria bacterium]|nr:hypothetical protein [Candidatus Eisenbacteria bacterium]